jgi:NAD(P)-dependent dehydrogenase (short-subunit alcohol dehydrogenase family)
MAMDLHDKVVLITGGKRIGAAVAEAVAGRGAHVVLTFNKSKAEADGTAAVVRKAGRRALVVQADVSDERACMALVAEIDRTFQRLDVVVNMASVYVNTPFDRMTTGDWQKQISVDLGATFLVSHAALPLLRKSGDGRIINFSDWLAASGRPRYKGYLGYYVAKAGVKALTEALALEVAKDGILVNAIAPGPILAPPGTTDEEHEAVEKSTPLGRWGGPEAIVHAVLALIDTKFITGETIRVDGGRHLS